MIQVNYRITSDFGLRRISDYVGYRIMSDLLSFNHNLLPGGASSQSQKWVNSRLEGVMKRKSDESECIPWVTPFINYSAIYYFSNAFLPIQ